MLRFFFIPILCFMIMPGCDQRPIRIVESGVEIITEQRGQGAPANAGDVVTIAYEVRLPDGQPILNNDRFSFQLGRGAVIEGIDRTVAGMRVGGHRIVLCPPSKHWGQAGYGENAIPPDTTLTLDVRLTALD